MRDDQTASGAAKESNLPTAGLRRPAGFEDRMGHQARAAPPSSLGAPAQEQHRGDVREAADRAEQPVGVAVVALGDLDEPGADEHEHEHTAGGGGRVDVDLPPALVAPGPAEPGQRLGVTP